MINMKMIHTVGLSFDPCLDLVVDPAKVDNHPAIHVAQAKSIDTILSLSRTYCLPRLKLFGVDLSTGRAQAPKYE